MDSLDDHVRGLVRSVDRARYLSAILAPKRDRAGLLALYAFDLEVRAIPDRVVEPLAGEIRLQWWRDTLNVLRAGGQSGNPVADALAAPVANGSLPVARMMAYLDHRAREFHDDPFQDISVLEAHFDATEGLVLSLASASLSALHDDPPVEAVLPAGRALGYVNLISEFAKQSSRGRVFLPVDLMKRHGVDPHVFLRGDPSGPLAALFASLRAMARDHLSEAKRHLRAIDLRLMPAFAHLSLLRGQLDRLERTGPFDGAATINPMAMQWKIWRAARTRRI